VQNSAPFRTTADFQSIKTHLYSAICRERIRGANISGMDKDFDVIDDNPSRVWRKRSSELWSINNTVLEVDSDPPKSTFSQDHILAPRGHYWLKFFHGLENDQGLLAHTPPDTGAPIFNNEHSKVGLNSA